MESSRNTQNDLRYEYLQYQFHCFIDETIPALLQSTTIIAFEPTPTDIIRYQITFNDFNIPVITNIMSSKN